MSTNHKSRLRSPTKRASASSCALAGATLSPAPAPRVDRIFTISHKNKFYKPLFLEFKYHDITRNGNFRSTLPLPQLESPASAPSPAPPAM